MRVSTNFYASVLLLALSACGGTSGGVSDSERPRPSPPQLSEAEFTAAKQICESPGTITPHHRNLDDPIKSPALCAPDTTPVAWRIDLVFSDSSDPSLKTFKDISNVKFELPFQKASNAKPSSADGRQNHQCFWSDRIDSETYPRARLKLSYDSVATNADLGYFQEGGQRTDGLSFEIELKANEDDFAVFDLNFPGPTHDGDFPLSCNKSYTVPVASIATTDGTSIDNIMQAVITPVYK